jgi:pyruvate,water dikinase
MAVQMEPQTNRFPSPFEVATPPGAEGWQEMYPYYHQFSEDRREFEESRLWFFDGMHHPEALYPFDAIMAECWQLALGGYNSRIFIVPPALGISQRILNGYLYISPEPVPDPAQIPARVEQFMKRAGHYYQNWDSIFEQWREKATRHIRALEALAVPGLPEMEDESVVFEHVGLNSGFKLLEAYDRAIDSLFQMWQYHFEMLNLGYAAYLTFLMSCRQFFPGIPDDTVAKMVSGLDILFFRPDDEVKKLARLALDLGVAVEIKRNDRRPEAIIGELQGSDRGRQWVEALEAAKDPWFNFSSGAGFYHHDRSWIDDLSVPFVALRSYIEKMERGEDLARPIEPLRQERDRIAAEYRALLKTDEDRKAFDDQLGLAKTVFPFVEDHNFYVEHWYHTVFWNKMRQFGAVLREAGFWTDESDVFYLNRHEVAQALYDAAAAWAVGSPARGPKYWPPIVERRKRILAVLREWAPPPALGPTPEEISEPFTIMLWGITTDRVKAWLQPASEGGDDRTLKGVAGSPGVAEGPARVVISASDIGLVQEGEILVCPITAPSWAPVFSRIKAAVSDIGGIMCHAAIVSREYGLPAVVGTGFGTKKIRTGQRLRVDGSSGLVSILD